MRKEPVMGLAWQQGPLSEGSLGAFLSPTPLPERLLYAEPLRRRMRVSFAGTWIVASEDVVLLHEPGRYPVAYFPQSEVAPGVLVPSDTVTEHRDLGPTAWYTVTVGETGKARSAWRHTALPEHAKVLEGRVAFAWRGMDAFYEEDERIVGHAADLYHRNDIRRTARHLVVRAGDRVVADTHAPLALYESGFAPRWYVPRADVDEAALTPVDFQTFCPYKGVCGYYDVAGVARAAWYYPKAWEEVARIRGLISFELDKLTVTLDGRPLLLEPGQKVIPHGIDRGLDLDELAGSGRE
jgi:uncharacterized protein (DUF427 family)